MKTAKILKSIDAKISAANKAARKMAKVEKKADVAQSTARGLGVWASLATAGCAVLGALATDFKARADRRRLELDRLQTRHDDQEKRVEKTEADYYAATREKSDLEAKILDLQQELNTLKARTTKREG